MARQASGTLSYLNSATESFEHSHAWALCCTGLVLASCALWLAAANGLVLPQPLSWRADAWLAAPWTLWSAPLVHYVLAHALADALALGAMGALGSLLAAQPRDALALLLAWPLATLGLLLWPQVGGYYGLSGLIHAAAAILALRGLASADTRSAGQWLAAGLLFKLALEHGWALPVGFDTGWGFNVVYAAHLTGAVAGAAMALLVRTIR